MAQAIASKKEFDELVSASSGTCLVDFWAPWCGPCQALAPILLSAEKKASGIGFYQVNVDDTPELAQVFHVSSIPTLIVFRYGKEIQRTLGVLSEAQILALLA
ncbi:MAG: thioredoxin [Candidatus Faecousia sp.]|nr:thioredoxin [Oscillospiraceae bacterium]MDD6856498.1 thioredoxin [Oscillospiraceae bacterium]MDY2557374.1 thioredoxin [Candidatus Faecousia sp.]